MKLLGCIKASVCLPDLQASILCLLLWENVYHSALFTQLIPWHSSSGEWHTFHLFNAAVGSLKPSCAMDNSCYYLPILWYIIVLDAFEEFCSLWSPTGETNVLTVRPRGNVLLGRRWHWFWSCRQGYLITRPWAWLMSPILRTPVRGEREKGRWRLKRPTGLPIGIDRFIWQFQTIQPLRGQHKKSLKTYFQINIIVLG